MGIRDSREASSVRRSTANSLAKMGTGTPAIFISGKSRCDPCPDMLTVAGVIVIDQRHAPARQLAKPGTRLARKLRSKSGPLVRLAGADGRTNPCLLYTSRCV